jgi:hypothetical protein
MNDSTVSRRDLFRLIAAASATGALVTTPGAAAPPPLTRNFKNILSDPDYSNPAAPWDKPLDEAELATLAVLVDLILPADELSPAASAIGVHDFLNEWAGAPYPENLADCEILRGGLAWLNTHAFQLHGKGFTVLDAARQTAILDGLCDPAKSTPELAIGTRFFVKLRMLALGGYYSHSSTWKSLGYVGNTPIAGPYPGVPDEVIRILGLEGEI